MKTATCRICKEVKEANVFDGVQTGTMLCNRCWELESRIERDPELAARVFARMHNNSQTEETELILPWSLYSLGCNGAGEPRWSAGHNGPAVYILGSRKLAENIVACVNACGNTEAPKEEGHCEFCCTDPDAVCHNCGRGLS